VPRQFYGRGAYLLRRRGTRSRESPRWRCRRWSRAQWWASWASGFTPARWSCRTGSGRGSSAA